jgi:hypothetical protein
MANGSELFLDVSLSQDISMELFAALLLSSAMGLAILKAIVCP